MSMVLQIVQDIDTLKYDQYESLIFIFMCVKITREKDASTWGSEDKLY